MYKNIHSTSLVALLLAIVSFLVGGFEFDHDSDVEWCKMETSRVPGICTTDVSMWKSCPITCSRLLSRDRGSMSEEREHPEQFYGLSARKLMAPGSKSDNGSEISLEDNEGYITLYAVIPMLQGMADYYYEAIEHIARVYKFTLVAMVQPYYNSIDPEEETSKSNDSLASIVEGRTNGAKSILLEAYDAQQEKDESDVLKYLLTRKVTARNGDFDDVEGIDMERYRDNDAMFLATRPNIFLVSSNGMFIERMVAPSMERIERRIKMHEYGMEQDL